MATPIEYALVLAALAVVGITAMTITEGILDEITPAASSEGSMVLSGDLLDGETGIGKVPGSRAALLSGLAGCGDGPPAFDDQPVSGRRAGKWKRRVVMSRPGCADSPAFSYTLVKDPGGSWVIEGDILPAAADAGEPGK